MRKAYQIISSNMITTNPWINHFSTCTSNLKCIVLMFWAFLKVVSEVFDAISSLAGDFPMLSIIRIR